MSLERYEEVLPGAADRIISMAEAEASERHKNSRGILGVARLAIVSSAAVILGVTAVAAWLIVSGQLGPGVPLAVLGPVAVYIAFGRRDASA